MDRRVSCAAWPQGLLYWLAGSGVQFWTRERFFNNLTAFFCNGCAIERTFDLRLLHAKKRHV
jgi:hypothetical protein